MTRDSIQRLLICPDCGAMGGSSWEETSTVNREGPQRRLLTLVGEFHAETGRTRSGDPVIVCNNCDAIQKG